ncbi:MAG: glutaredoxin family protein [Chloroflexota bacterium]|nr:MAG: glutaredoxin family protein [Chloroflexota bacterium]
MLWRKRFAIRVTIYTKQGCGLCDEAMRMLQSLQGEFVLAIEEVDITQDPAMYERYKYVIPVIDVEGGERLLPIFKEGDLRRALRAARHSS